MGRGFVRGKCLLCQPCARGAESYSFSPVRCAKTRYGIASSQLSCRSRQARYPGSQRYGYRRQRWSWRPNFATMTSKITCVCHRQWFLLLKNTHISTTPCISMRTPATPSDALPSLLLSARSTRTLTCVTYCLIKYI